ncbi:FAD-dependent oxidoreductase [Streptomyces sp. NPDC048479]|uniref:FAD-dependent oxidoreductase n=1 Tax=Streptomyces sp. NPDC048479 TaxID=3154725 RepID=UPI00341F07A2
MSGPRAVVIGSGIGGLTAAVALRLSGWQVTVLERAASLEPVGAGIGLAHHAAPDGDLAAGLAAYRAERLPRTAAVVRKSAQIARLMSLTSTPAVAVRNTLMSAVSRFGPGLVLRTFDGIADWQPPQRTYAAGAQDVPEAQSAQRQGRPL